MKYNEKNKWGVGFASLQKRNIHFSYPRLISLIGIANWTFDEVEKDEEKRSDDSYFYIVANFGDFNYILCLISSENTITRDAEGNFTAIMTTFSLFTRKSSLFLSERCYGSLWKGNNSRRVWSFFENIRVECFDKQTCLF